VLVQKGFQFAVRLRPEQDARLRQWAGCRRFVYNDALAFQKAELAAGRKRPTYVALSARLTKQKLQFDWLRSAPAQCLQQALKDLDRSWNLVFRTGAGVPRFKKRGDPNTLRFPQDCHYDPTTGGLTLPKLGQVRLRHSRIATGTLKNVTVREECGRWIAVLQTAAEVTVLARSEGAVGLDFGVASTMTLSTGAAVKLPERISRYERRMKRELKSLGRKRFGSANRKKNIRRIQECGQRVASLRKDFLHKATTAVCKSNALVAIEDLRVGAMTASASKSFPEAGRNVRQKTGLNRTILRNGWSMARTMLEYKQSWTGGRIVAVSPAYTSQECSECGHVSPANRVTQSRFCCVLCGHVEHADMNAAKNILARGIRLDDATTRDGSVSELCARFSGEIPDSTAGCAGTHACDGGCLEGCPSRPRSAVQEMSVGISLAGTCSVKSLAEQQVESASIQHVDINTGLVSFWRASLGAANARSKDNR
jgi:putative transposase